MYIVYKNKLYPLHSLKKKNQVLLVCGCRTARKIKNINDDNINNIMYYSGWRDSTKTCWKKIPVLLISCRRHFFWLTAHVVFMTNHRIDLEKTFGGKFNFLLSKDLNVCNYGKPENHTGSFSRRVRNNKKEDEEDDSEGNSNSCRQCSLSLFSPWAFSQVC